MAEKDKEGTVNKIRHDQYFAILLDCIRDTGNIE
jgi:hypothetical protein